MPCLDADSATTEMLVSNRVKATYNANVPDFNSLFSCWLWGKNPKPVLDVAPTKFSTTRIHHVVTCVDSRRDEGASSHTLYQRLSLDQHVATVTRRLSVTQMPLVTYGICWHLSSPRRSLILSMIHCKDHCTEGRNSDSQVREMSEKVITVAKWVSFQFVLENW